MVEGARPWDAMIRQLANAALRLKSVDRTNDSGTLEPRRGVRRHPNGLQQELH
jgi:hypothetical protein